MKKKSAPKGTLLFFGLIGLVFFLIGVVWLILGIRFVSNAEEVYGVITDITSYRDSDGDRHYTAYVNYEFDGEYYYDVALSSYSSSMREGKEVKVLVDPENPGEPQTIMSSIVGGIIFAVFGAIFASVGFVPMLLMGRTGSKGKKLKEQGRYIMAKIESIEQNRKVAINGRHPYIIYCSHEDVFSGMVYRFKSKSLWYDPDAYFPVGMEIKVYVDGQDYSKYYVDVDEPENNRVVDYT